ncbi:MAG: NAD(P)-dependent oxidoreductase [Chitinophagaceae bacterium]|nr:NAD(P)-dependent oxidoreductase [Chitinophagaceae bacterium]
MAEGKKILITGASGFVGFHLIETALEAGFKVVAAIRGSSNVAHLQSFEIEYTQIDFSDKESIRRNFSENQYQYVLHAAGATKAKNLDEYNEINAQYALNIAEVAAEFPIKKFVFLSSLAALGPIAYDSENAIGESNTPYPVSDYGRSKLLAENLLLKLKELPLIILRPTAVYGPRERDILIMFKTLNGGIEPYIGRKGQWLSFIYVKDLVDVAIAALHSDKVNTIYNLSDGNAYSRYELATLSKQILRKKTLKLHVPMPIVKVIAQLLERMSGANKTPTLNTAKLDELTAENWNCCIAKVQSDLGYNPQFNLESGLKATLKWYQENKWL